MKIYLINRGDIVIFSDGKKLKIFKEKGREFVDAPIMTDGRVFVRAIRRSEFSYRNWWLYSAFFWVIGIFGIFTPKYSRFDYALDCTVSMDGSQTHDVWLRFNNFVGKKGTIPLEAVTVSEGTTAKTENAVYIYDKTSHRRRIIYKLASWVLRIILIFIIIFKII